MATKTVFANGSILTPAFLNAEFGTTGATGHAHDGVNADGHAPLVDIENHTTGSLTYDRIVWTSGVQAITFNTDVYLAAHTINFYYQVMQVGASQAVVFLSWPAFYYQSGGANAINFWSGSGQHLPAAIRPTGGSVQLPLTVYNYFTTNSPPDTAPGEMMINNDGSFAFAVYDIWSPLQNKQLYANYGGWDATHNKGLAKQTVSYPLFI